MTCPRCASRVPAKALWTSTGFAGIVCPHCHASLCPKAFCTIVLFAICLGLGEASLLILQWRGANFALGLLGFFAAFAGAYALAAPVLLKLRVKDDAVRPLADRRI
jgi:hypothetical protein